MSDQQSESDGNAVTISSSNADSVLHLPLEKIVEDKEYSTLIPPLSREEYESLKHDIAVNNIKIPLIINSNRVLLDGYTRLRIARELGLSTVPCMIRNTQDRLEEELFIITVNANRRHMNTAQKAELALKVLEIEQESARLRRLSALRQYSNRGGEDDTVNRSNMTSTGHNDRSTVVGSGPTTVGRSVEIAANRLKISDKTLKKVKRIKDAAMKNKKIAEYWQEALQGKRSVHSVYERVKEKEAREAVRPVIEEGKRALDSVFSVGNTSSATTVRILHGDFRKVLKDVPDNSIGMIFTDPPYGEEYLYLIRDLAIIAARILKPSGFLAVMYGQDHLDRFFLAMDEAIRGTSSTISITGSDTGSGIGSDNGAASPEHSYSYSYSSSSLLVLIA